MSVIVIKGGEIVNAGERYVADIVCEGGLIKAIGADLDPPAGAEVIDASGRYVFPGGVDAHTHMELPFMGTVSADDFFTGTAAGLAGGTTSIIDFIIPGRNQSLLQARDAWMDKAAKSAGDYAFHMAVTWFSEQVDREMREVFSRDGISSFKTFMAYTGAIGVDDEELIGIIDTAADLGALVTAHCEHGQAVVAMQKKLLAAGKTAPRYHAQSRPTWVEGEATNRAIMLARNAGQPIYIVHLTCKESLDAVYRARQAGQLVWVETCPQYLLLDDTVYNTDDFEGAAFVMSPPIRPAGHQEYLWNGLALGAIHTVATDHCPFRQEDQKSMGADDFTKIPNGAAGVENRMALMYTYGVTTGRLTLEQFVDVCCTRPAQIFNLHPRKGTVRVGSDADLVVYDPSGTSRISAKTHRHQVDRNIFEGFEIKGGVTHTVANGVLVYAEGDLRAQRGAGRYLPRHPATRG